MKSSLLVYPEATNSLVSCTEHLVLSNHLINALPANFPIVEKKYFHFCRKSARRKFWWYMESESWQGFNKQLESKRTLIMSPSCIVLKSPLHWFVGVAR